jgi:hypothetical protein
MFNINVTGALLNGKHAAWEFGSTEAAFDRQLLCRSIDRIPSIHHHRCSLHKTRFTAGKEQNAICHFLRRSHAIHRCDGNRRAQDFGIRLGHWRVDDARADCVDSNEVFGVLLRKGLVGGRLFTGGLMAYVDCVASGHVDYCCFRAAVGGWESYTDQSVLATYRLQTVVCTEMERQL